MDILQTATDGREALLVMMTGVMKILQIALQTIVLVKMYSYNFNGSTKKFYSYTVLC